MNYIINYMLVKIMNYIIGQPFNSNSGHHSASTITEFTVDQSIRQAALGRELWRIFLNYLTLVLLPLFIFSAVSSLDEIDVLRNKMEMKKILCKSMWWCFWDRYFQLESQIYIQKIKSISRKTTSSSEGTSMPPIWWRGPVYSTCQHTG